MTPTASASPRVPRARGRLRARLAAALGTPRRRLWLVVVLISLGLCAVEIPTSVALYRVPVELVFVLVVAHVGALSLTLVRPRSASGLAVAAAVVLALFSTTGSATAPWPWSVMAMITQAFALALIAWRTPWWWALVAWAGSAAASVLVAFVMIAREPLAGALTDIVVFANVSLITVAAGVVVRQTQQGRRELAEERETSESERTRRQLADERARIARELHDVVAHSMSILNVQATSAPYRHPGLTPEVSAEFEQIAAQTRTTLAEMRRLLTVLRTDAPEAGPDGSAGPVAQGTAVTAVLPVDLAPQPGLDDLAALIDQARGAGLEILYQPGAAHERPVDDTVGLTAYRIVQEALSNVIRHAPGAAATVTLQRDARMLELTVRNSAARSPRPRTDTGRLSGAGFGLRGMRERAEAVGGTVEYGPTDDGGYRVNAVLPIGTGAAG